MRTHLLLALPAALVLVAPACASSNAESADQKDEPVAGARALYLAPGGALVPNAPAAASAATVPYAPVVAGADHVAAPPADASLVATFVARGVSGAYTGGGSSLLLRVDAGPVVGVATVARVSYDFDGDGRFDRVERGAYFAIDAAAGWEDDRAPFVDVSGAEYRAMTNGTIRLELWNAFGPAGADVAVGGGAASWLAIPYDGSTSGSGGGAPIPPPPPPSSPPPSPSPGPTPTPPRVGDGPRTFTFHNRCAQPVWVGALTGGAQYPLPDGGGWRLDPGASSAIGLPQQWIGRFWGRTECQFDGAGNGTCATGDCGGKEKCGGAGGRPPASLAEFTLGAPGGDFYDVSLVDGYNLPIDIAPRAGTFTRTNPSSPYDCGTPTCTKDLNATCPAELQQRDAQGRVVACMSACEKFDTDAYCCRGAYGTPDKCPPTGYSQTFKDACPSAYSYAYDDHTSTFTCRGGDYDITFCP